MKLYIRNMLVNCKSCDEQFENDEKSFKTSCINCYKKELGYKKCKNCKQYNIKNLKYERCYDCNKKNNEKLNVVFN